MVLARHIGERIAEIFRFLEIPLGFITYIGNWLSKSSSSTLTTNLR